MRHRCETCQTVDGHVGDCVENTPPDDLPDGLFEQDGKVMYICRSCDRHTEVQCDVADFDPEMAYCGATQWCIP